ncbi:fimbria/pilus outer membrane usher protein [Escherichia coli]|uniref:fimbrial protein n=3 Tax=Escherichia coli TaxID=562 RepID=UPI002FE52A0D
MQVAGYRYSTQGFYNLSDSAYSRMSGYTVKPPTGDTNEQTQFIDYFNLFYSKRGQEQISISQQLGNYGTTFFSASRQSYWNTSRSDQQISFGLNVPFGDITTSLNYSYSNNIWQNDRDYLLAFTLNATFCALFTATLQAADVTITVNGRVVAKPCTIQTKEANVNLGDLYTRNLQQPGSASGWHNITLSLTDCPVETSVVTAIVTGSTDNTGYYKNEGTAENIQIELRDDQDATLKNGDSKTVIVDEITRNAQFPLKARAITVNGNASQGTIEALINMIYTWQ